jgi:hypothetical protein
MDSYPQVSTFYSTSSRDIESSPQLIAFKTTISYVFSAFWTNEGKVPLKPLLLSSKNSTGGLYPREL